MSRDRIREESEKSSLDHMSSLGMAALTAGVGAALFYRGGGKRALSRGAGVSQRFLRGAKNELGSLKLNDLSAEKIKSVSNRALKGETSALRKAITDTEEKRHRLRVNTPKNVLGLIQGHDTLMKQRKQIIAREYRNREVAFPAARMFSEKFAPDNAEMARRIERFAFDATDNINSTAALRKSLKKQELDQDLSATQAEEMLQFIKSRMSDKDKQRAFSESYEKILDQAKDRSLDIEQWQKTMGESEGGFLESVLGDRYATVSDVINNERAFRGNLVPTYDEKSKETVTKEAVTVLKNMREKIQKEQGDEALSTFLNLKFDSTLRIDTSGEFVNLAEAADLGAKVTEGFSRTLLGQIFKTRPMIESTKTPNFLYTPASGNKSDAILSALANTSANQITPESSFIRLADRTFELTPEGLNTSEALDNTFLVSHTDIRARLVNKMSGNTSYRKSTNKFQDIFDIGKEGSPTILDDVFTKIRKFDNPEWAPHAIKDFVENSQSIFIDLEDIKQAGIRTEEQAAWLDQVTDQIRSINTFFSKSVYELDSNAISALSDKASGRAKEYLDLLKLEDTDLLQRLMQKDGSSYRDITSHHNQDLVSLLNKYMTDPVSAKNMVSMRTDRSGFFGGKESVGFFEALRTELSKEALIMQAAETAEDGRYDFSSLIDLIGEAEMPEASRREASRLAVWAGFQQSTGVSARYGKVGTVDSMIDSAQSVARAFTAPKEGTTNADFFRYMQEEMPKLIDDKLSSLDTNYADFQDHVSIFQSDPNYDYVHMQKSVSIKDVLKNLNDEEKLKAFGKQFIAGRDNMTDVTNATLAPYFMVSRLSDPLSKIGLSLSTQSMSSVGSLTSAIALKRVLPIAIGATYFDYTNDMVELATGTSLTGAMASGVAHIDLGMRSITDATGLTDVIKKEKEINPFLSYYTGDDYMGEEERRAWYQDGYSEMRKTRWWNFGSINEWRGTEVQYYQPNYLKRAHSNWKDAALYDSTWEKWSRSWLPTPTNPISPFIYLTNPYWLEEKHAEDRPYPVTGAMFTEQSPWGAVLNPTVGAVIKPKKRMHEDRLDENFVDTKAIIEAENRAQFDRAKSKESAHLIRVSDGIIEPAVHTSLHAPTPSDRLASFNIYDGQVQHLKGGESFESVTGPAAFSDYGKVFDEASMINFASGEGTPIQGLATEQEATMSDESLQEIREMTGDIGARARRTVRDRLGLQAVESVNNEAIVRAQSMPRIQNEGVVTAESINQVQARYGSHILRNKEALSDLKGLSSGDDFIGEMAYTAKYMSGIYGYGTYRLFPGAPRTKLADPSRMTSPVRSFWDANIGGLGGGYVEIFRRFIPSTNPSVESFNPLMNTMPEWMPENFRFGDPYTQMPKGEMRLPGKGFEDLHDLHSDEFGRYGAFDRFKILADVAPGSSEYKVWRDIATKTIDDPDLKQEIREIKNRVSEQMKSYDFHHYKFLGQETERKVGTVDEIINNNYFTIVGDDRTYRLAGITAGGEDTLFNYMSPGTEVVMMTDPNVSTGINDDAFRSTNAAVMVDGININRTLLDEGFAERRENDRSSAATRGLYTDFQTARGSAMELMAHAPIPYFQQKYFKMRTPLESYKHEFVYGTPYASWQSPIKSFLEPAINRSLMSDKEIALGAGMLGVNIAVNNFAATKGPKTAANAALMLTNRGAFIGGFMGKALVGGGSSMKAGAYAGAAMQMGAWAFTRKDQVLPMTVAGGGVGAIVGAALKDVGIEKGGAIGAGIGLGTSLLFNNSLENGLLGEEWIPEKTKEKWEVQEYFDRLEYIKYSGLYSKAARKARIKEGVDVKRIIRQHEREEVKNSALKEELEEHAEVIRAMYHETDPRAERLLAEIDSQVKSMANKSDVYLTGGDYTRSALMYKQAMDSTIYGLQENASFAQLIRSVPANERDHFVEFSKETDPKKQEEILSYVSPYMKRALQIAWGETPDEVESNASFFNRHQLPAPMWSGWRPDVDLKDVEIKTIANEGMLLSDFGHYESSLRDASVISATPLDYSESGGHPIQIRNNLIRSLNGFGLTGVEVNVEPTASEGINVVANVAQRTTQTLEKSVRRIMSFA